MGNIESGVRETLKREGIEIPTTALEMLAIELGNTLDHLLDEKNKAGLSRELRLTLEGIHYQPKPADDAVDRLAALNI